MFTAINGNHFGRVSRQNENKLQKKYVKKWHCALRITFIASGVLVSVVLVVVVVEKEVVVLVDSRCSALPLKAACPLSAGGVWTGDLHFPSES